MIFYFDEAFHDKAITFKNHTLNLEKDNVEEFYVGCYIGSDDWETIEKACFELEQKHLKTLGTNVDAELKSTALIKMSKLQNWLLGISKKEERTLRFFPNGLRIKKKKRMQIFRQFLRI